MMIRNLAMSGISVVGALGIAAPANADQYDFISVLDNNGVYYYNISEMIDLGKAACRTVRTGGTIGSVDSAINLLTRAGFNAVMDPGNNHARGSEHHVPGYLARPECAQPSSPRSPARHGPRQLNPSLIN